MARFSWILFCCFWMGHAVGADLEPESFYFGSGQPAEIFGITWPALLKVPDPAVFVKRRFGQLAKLFHPDHQQKQDAFPDFPDIRDALKRHRQKKISLDRNYEPEKAIRNVIYQRIVIANKLLNDSLKAGIAGSLPMEESSIFSRRSGNSGDWFNPSAAISAGGDLRRAARDYSGSKIRDTLEAFFSTGTHRKIRIDAEREKALAEMGFDVATASFYDPATQTWTELFTGLQFIWDPSLRRYLNPALGMYFFPGRDGNLPDSIFDPREHRIYWPCFVSWMGEDFFRATHSTVDLPVLSPMPQALKDASRRRLSSGRAPDVEASPSTSLEPISLRKAELAVPVNLNEIFTSLHSDNRPLLEKFYRAEREVNLRRLYLNGETMIVGLYKTGLGDMPLYQGKPEGHRSQQVLEAALNRALEQGTQEAIGSQLAYLESELRSMDEEVAAGSIITEKEALARFGFPAPLKDRTKKTLDCGKALQSKKRK